MYQYTMYGSMFVGSVSRFTTFVPDVVALRALCGTPLLARACDREQEGNL